LPLGWLLQADLLSIFNKEIRTVAIYSQLVIDCVASIQCCVYYSQIHCSQIVLGTSLNKLMNLPRLSFICWHFLFFHCFCFFVRYLFNWLVISLFFYPSVRCPSIHPSMCACMHSFVHSFIQSCIILTITVPNLISSSFAEYLLDKFISNLTFQCRLSCIYSQCNITCRSVPR